MSKRVLPTNKMMEYMGRLYDEGDSQNVYVEGVGLLTLDKMKKNGWIMSFVMGRRPSGRGGWLEYRLTAAGRALVEEARTSGGGLKR